jgi:hypothetical protein
MVVVVEELWTRLVAKKPMSRPETGFDAKLRS